ncbi:phage NrS-1 polymerase family protein [Deinococcus malanensis]|uniref:phage NrS-1 polymerase family protein n=1 Tax=Deinococcus malanensis TaxID=1706855 RepID=UPI0016688696|nr:hypothetical protein [Deinococcus malanensis]
MTAAFDSLSVRAERIRRHWPEGLQGLRAYLPYQVRIRASGRPGKVPCRLSSGRLYPVNPLDVRHHLVLDQATALLEAGACDGLGIVLDGRPVLGGLPLLALDLDGVVERGEVSPGARELVRTVDSLTEVSVSGRGLHCVALGTLDRPGRRGKLGHLGLEWIDRGFLTVSGNALDGYSRLLDRGDVLRDLHRRSLPRPADLRGPRPADLTLDDQVILRRLRAARNAPKFLALFEQGDLSGYQGDPSRADLALLRLLCWYTRDPVQLRRLWQGSALGRSRGDRWAQRVAADGRDYSTYTIDTALAMSCASG